MDVKTQSWDQVALSSQTSLLETLDQVMWFVEQVDMLESSTVTTLNSRNTWIQTRPLVSHVVMEQFSETSSSLVSPKIQIQVVVRYRSFPSNSSHNSAKSFPSTYKTRKK